MYILGNISFKIQEKFCIDQEQMIRATIKESINIIFNYLPM